MAEIDKPRREVDVPGDWTYASAPESRDIVHVRDPWGLNGPGSGTGTRATLSLADFKLHWHGAIHQVVIPAAIN